MTSLSRVLVATALGAGTMALSTANASAAIACTGPVCWHVSDRYEYPHGSRVIIHEDTWKPRGRIEFREHEGRGYWRGREWREW
jgi:hypothetical protein